MGSLARVTIASESAYEINCSLRASAIYIRVSTISGFMSAETPTMAQPRHQLSLGFSRGQHTVTSTPTATPASR